MINVLVKCPPRGEFKGYNAAQQHWPEGVTKRPVTAAQVESLKVAGVITLIAVGDEAIADWEAANAPREPAPAVVKAPQPGQPGSPAQPLAPAAPSLSAAELAAKKAEEEAAEKAAYLAEHPVYNLPSEKEYRARGYTGDYPEFIKRETALGEERGQKVVVGLETPVPAAHAEEQTGEQAPAVKVEPVKVEHHPKKK